MESEKENVFLNKPKPSILVLSFTNLKQDVRIRRQILSLCEKYAVTAVGNQDPAIPGVYFLPTGYHNKTLSERFIMYSCYLFRHFEKAYWYPAWLRDLRVKLEEKHYELVIANDVDTLPLAFAIRSKHGVFLDAHEYAPREFDNSFLWCLLFQTYKEYLCKHYIPRTTKRMTVAPGIASEYERVFGYPFEVITNTPAFRPIPVRPTCQHKIHLVHHGMALPGRGLEAMVQAMNMVDDRFCLHLYLVGNERQTKKLKKMTFNSNNVKFHPPVPPDAIVRELGNYDVGLSFIQPVNFNWEHCLPNKFFEFIQGRLAIVTGPSVELLPLMQKYSLGLVCRNFDPKELAESLNSLTSKKIDTFKQNSAYAAHLLCAERNTELLLDLVEEIIHRQSSIESTSGVK